MRQRGRDDEHWPDGGGLADQPIRLIQAIGEVHRYLDENEPRGQETEK